MSKYSSKLSGLNRVNWDNKTEKQKANYFKKAYTDLGLNIPKYILNGKMSEKQLQSSINKLTRSLQSRAKKEQSRARKQKSNKSNVNLSGLVKEMKKAYENYVSNIPEEYRNSKVFMNFFTKGHSLKTDSFDVPIWGKDFYIADTVGELEEHYQTKNKKLLKETIKAQINELKNNTFDKQKQRLLNKALRELGRLEQEINDGMSTPNSESLRKIIQGMKFHEIMQIGLLLENNGNVWDSIYNNDKLGGGQHDFDMTLKKVYDIATKYGIDKYKN